MSHLIDLDVAFYMHLIQQFDLAHVKCDVKTGPNLTVTMCSSEVLLLIAWLIARLIAKVNHLILFDLACWSAISETKANPSDHPYEQFLVGQKQRQHEWQKVRESKRTEVAESAAPVTVTSSSPQDNAVTILHQQLAAKTEECHQLMNKLAAMEEANTKILSCQMQMQENFVKVMH